MDYRISGERLKGFADQVRRISGVEGELTPEQMEANLLNITPLGEHPKAEEGTFGDDDASVEVGIASIVGSIKGYTYSKHLACAYKANEAISIVGLRLYNNGTSASGVLKLYLWNANNELLAKVNDVSVTIGYADVYFDNPVNVGINETFIISTSKHKYGGYYSVSSGWTISGKITFQGSGAGDTNPPTCTGTSTAYGICCPIIGALSTVELPDEYQIDRSTMDDIANEIKRISGATGKITVDAILATLQGLDITLQSKTVTPSDTEQTVTPDDGYYGLSSVTVEAIPTA